MVGPVPLIWASSRNSSAFAIIADIAHATTNKPQALFKRSFNGKERKKVMGWQGSGSGRILGGRMEHNVVCSQASCSFFPVEVTPLRHLTSHTVWLPGFAHVATMQDEPVVRVF
jgi:hypothetical protein